MSQALELPRWLKSANRLVILLQHLGITLGSQHVLAIPGRTSGKLRATPVSLLTVDGRRYVATVGETDWVKNARAAGWGWLRRGRTEERIVLTELPAAARGAILRELPIQIPRGVPFFQMVHGVAAEPEAFAALAPRCPVFRIDPAPFAPAGGS